MSGLGSQFRSARKALGLTQRQLAEKVGVAQGAISDLETDKGNPSLATIETVVAAMGMTLTLTRQETEG